MTIDNLGIGFADDFKYNYTEVRLFKGFVKISAEGAQQLSIIHCQLSICDKIAKSGFIDKPKRFAQFRFSPFLCGILVQHAFPFYNNRCIGYTHSQLRQSIPCTIRHEPKVGQPFGPDRLGTVDSMDNLPPAKPFKARDMLRRFSEACVDTVRIIGHYRNKLTPQRNKLLRSFKAMGKRTERPAHSKTDFLSPKRHSRSSSR